MSLGDERIAARTVLWAAGVAASPLARTLGVPLDRAGRVLVEPDLTIPGHDEVFVIGDLASLEQDGKPVPGVAPAAMQEGRHAARQHPARARAASRAQPFRYRDKGSLRDDRPRARRSREPSAASSSRACSPGSPGSSIHIFFLIGFRNRLLVLFQWAWSYLTFQRGARLITGPPRPRSGSLDAVPGCRPTRRRRRVMRLGRETIRPAVRRF